MGDTSKDLLHLEHKNSTTSPLESTLLVCKKDKKDSVFQSQKPHPDGKPITATFPKSQVLGKVKDFLGVISDSNEYAKDNYENFDIEVLTGNESEIIEMDLMLGVADLQTPEAVAAAESAIAGYQPVIPLAASSSETESEDSSDDDSDDDDNGDHKSNKTRSHLKLKKSKSDKEGSSGEDANQPEKWPKIVELS